MAGSTAVQPTATRGLRRRGERCATFWTMTISFIPITWNCWRVCCARTREADLVLGSAMAMFVAKDGTVTEVRPMVFDRIDRFTMCQNCRIPIQTVLFRRSLFERYGGLIETLEAHEDWGMMLKYLEHGRRITPHAPDVRRPPAFRGSPRPKAMRPPRMEAYRKSDADFTVMLRCASTSRWRICAAIMTT